MLHRNGGQCVVGSCSTMHAISKAHGLIDSLGKDFIVSHNQCVGSCGPDVKEADMFFAVSEW